MFVRGMVLTSLEDRSRSTTRNEILFFVMRNRSRISIATNSSVAVAGNSCILFLFRWRATLLMAKADTTFCNFTPVRRHIWPENASAKELVNVSSTRVSCHFGSMAQVQYVWYKILGYYHLLKIFDGAIQDAFAVKRERNSFPLPRRPHIVQQKSLSFCDKRILSEVIEKNDGEV